MKTLLVWLVQSAVSLAVRTDELEKPRHRLDVCQILVMAPFIC